VTLQPEVLAVDPFGGDMVVEWLLDVAAAPCAFVATFGGRHPDDVLSRLVVMGLQGQAKDASAVRSQIAMSLDLLVHLGRYEDRVIVSQVSDVGLEAGELSQQLVFQSRMGPGGLEFNATGHVPRLFSALMESGVDFDTSIFNT
jgi:pilus assembly protein CpaF